MAEYCDDGRFAVRRTIWESQNQYRSVPSKYLGWAGGFDGVEQRAIQVYGCTTIIAVGVEWVDHAIALGYSPQNVVMGFSDYSFTDTFPAAKARGVNRFYLDEPVQNDKLGLLSDSCNFAASIGCRVLTSESSGGDDWLLNPWAPVRRLARYVKDMPPVERPFVGCHTYFHMGVIFGSDPRDQWTYLRNELGSLFNFAWIRLRSNQSDYEIGLLFGHANNLGGIERLFYGFWPGEPGWPSGPDHRVERASVQAHTAGWLQRLQREREDKYCCLTQIFDPETCYLESSRYTGNERWL